MTSQTYLGRRRLSWVITILVSLHTSDSGAEPQKEHSPEEPTYHDGRLFDDAKASHESGNDAAIVKNDVDGPRPTLRFATQVSPIANLFYQIECLGGRIRCSRAAFQELWEDLGGLSESDQAAITGFSNTLGAYGFRVQLGSVGRETEISHARFGTEIVDIGPPPTHSFFMANRIRIAAYASEGPDELRERLGILMHADDTSRLMSAVEALWPRFERWWVDKAEANLRRFDEDLKLILEQQNRLTLPAIIEFFRYELPDEGLTLTVHLMAHPSETSSTSAEVIENQAVVEVLDGEKPETRVGVVIHELVHYLFATSPQEMHDIRLEGALRSGNQRAAAALGLMNEALATAIGNGYVEKMLRGDQFGEYLETDLSFYAQPEIDRAAKAIFPAVARYLDDARGIDDEFADAYYRLVTESVGEALDSVASRLRVSAYIASDENLAQVMRQVPRLLRMNSLYGTTIGPRDVAEDSVLHRHSYLNGVVLMREDGRRTADEMLPEAGGAIREFTASTLGSCKFVRDSGSAVYFVVIDSEDVTPEQVIASIEAAETCS